LCEGKAAVLTVTTDRRAATRLGFDFGLFGLSQGHYTHGARLSAGFLMMTRVKDIVGEVLENCNRWRVWLNRMSAVCEREQDRVADSRASAIVAPPTKSWSRALSLTKQQYCEFSINDSRKNIFSLINNVLLLILLPVCKFNKN